MQTAQQTAKPKKKLPFWAPWLIGYAAVLAVAVGLVYCWRVMFMLTSLPAWPATLAAVAILTILYALIFCIQHFCSKNHCLQGFLLVLVAGLLFCFFTAPLQVPDEERYFLRAYSISTGHLDYDYNRGYPNDVNLLRQYFPNTMNHSVRYEAGQLAPSRMAAYYHDVENNVPSLLDEREPISFYLLLYLPQVTGMLLARLFGAGALGCLYAARVANLLAYAAICYLAFRNCAKYRGVFFAFALLPLSLFIAASCSPDAIMLAMCYLAVSYFCKAEIHTRDVWIFGIAIAYATVLKPMSIVLAVVLLLIPESRWKTRFNPRWAALIIVGGALLVYFGSGVLNGMRTFNYPPSLPRGVGEGADPTTQTMFILSNPFRFIATAVLTLYENAGFLFQLGTFGWLDLSIPLVGGLSVLSLACSSALGIQQKEDTKNTGALALFLAAGLFAAAVIAGLYITHSDVGSIRVTGLQARYFLPAFLLLFMLGSILLGKAVRPRLATQGTMVRTEKITLWIAAAVAIFAAVMIFQNYFIGQWLPKSEGGWKLVNLFGWMLT